jgi:predicted dehydrogenase
MEPVRWGVLGTSKYAREWIVPGMMKSLDVRVVAVGSRTKLKAETFANDIGIPRAYGSYEDLLADPEIEAIYNPLPNHLHVPMTLAATRAGKHVLCEKPIALTATEAELLRMAPRGLLVAEAFMIRHHPQWHEVRKLVRSGSLGRIHTVQAFFSFYLDDPGDVRHQPEWGGGSLLDIGVYPVVAARFVFESEPRRAIALIDVDPRFKTDRLVTGIIDFGEGRRVDFTVSTQAVAHQRLEIFGTSGRVELPIPFNPPLGGTAHVLVDANRAIGSSASTPRETAAVDQYQLEAEAFGRAVRGLEPLAYGVEDAIANMRAVDALFRSSATNRWEIV